MEIDLERVHDVLDDDGSVDGQLRVLVDRLWPRGVRKDRLVHDRWDKDVAPSTELRKAFHGGDLGFEAFAERYRAELAQSGAAEALLAAAREAGSERLSLLYAAADAEQNHALVLREVLEETQGSRDG